MKRAVPPALFEQLSYATQAQLHKFNPSWYPGFTPRKYLTRITCQVCGHSYLLRYKDRHLASNSHEAGKRRADPPSFGVDMRVVKQP